MTAGDTDPGLILNPEYWGRNGFPHAAARWLRENDPIRWYESELVDPFWLVTRHADVVEVSRNSQLWSSTERIMIEARRSEPLPFRTMLHMDPPEHTRLRSLLARGFSPKMVATYEDRIREIATDLIETAAQHDSFDMKPNAPQEIRGEFRPIATSRKATMTRIVVGTAAGRVVGAASSRMNVRSRCALRSLISGRDQSNGTSTPPRISFRPSTS